MVKDTQTIPRQFTDELFEFVRPFCGIGAEKVKSKYQSLLALPNFAWLSFCQFFW